MSDSENSIRAEKIIKSINGFAALAVIILLFILMIPLFLIAIKEPASVLLLIISCTYWGIIFPVLLFGLRIINPNEAAVYVLFGKYYGTLIEEGFYWINPFCVSFNPVADSSSPPEEEKSKVPFVNLNLSRGKVSLKADTLNGEKQKVNDREGNPVEISAVIIWRIVNATKAVFEVENYSTYLSAQCDSAIRHVARMYPYDTSQGGSEKSLLGSSEDVAEEIKTELQKCMNIAGIEIIDVRISHIAYAPEIADVMLKRQQTAAIIDAKKQLADGAVAILETAFSKLGENGIDLLDGERKAALFSDFLSALCRDVDLPPVENKTQQKEKPQKTKRIKKSPD